MLPLLTGLPSNNAVLLCVKTALADPYMIDEFVTLISKKAGIPQFKVLLGDLEKALEILKGSALFWAKITAMGIGKKLDQPTTRPKKKTGKVKTIRRLEGSDGSSSSSSSSGSDSSPSSSSGDEFAGGLDLGFSEDETEVPVKQKIAKRVIGKPKPKRDVSDSESDSAGSESDVSMAPAGAASRPPPKTPETPSTPSSSSSSSSSEEEVSDKKQSLKKKLAGLAARRRAEQAAEANEVKEKKRAVPKPPVVDPVGSAASPAAPTAPRAVEKPAEEKPATPAEGSASVGGVGRARKLRQPARTGKENIASSPPRVVEQPEAKRVRVESVPPPAAAAVPVVPEAAPTPPPVDWNSDFGRLVKQAIENRKICPFRTLGLSPASTMVEVKKRWAKLCLLLHPDKAPLEWKSVPELVDANQAVNDAKKMVEQRFQAVALVRPQRPGSRPTDAFTLDKGSYGKRRIEVRWNPSAIASSREKVERYLVFILHGTDARRRDQMLNVGSVKEGTDPFFVIVEDDQRFARFFQESQMTITVLASNAAGNSDPLTIVVPLR